LIIIILSLLPAIFEFIKHKFGKKKKKLIPQHTNFKEIEDIFQKIKSLILPQLPAIDTILPLAFKSTITQ